jgi:hypothetical protein
MNQRLYTIPSPEALLSFLRQAYQPPDAVIQMALNAELSGIIQHDWNQPVPKSNTTYH